MSMRRREVLRLLLAGAAGMAFDVERLLWTPGSLVSVPAMPTGYYYGTVELTLLEWARRMDPEGKQTEVLNLIEEWSDTYEPLSRLVNTPIGGQIVER